jgi:hypothetical protein
MKGEGFWLNWETGTLVSIHEHEQDIRSPGVAKTLGVPTTIFRQFGRYMVGRDRIKFLRWLLKQVPLIRVRDHAGEHVTFDFAAGSNTKPYAAIKIWARERGGPTTLLMLANIQTQRHRTILAHQFLKNGDEK